MGRLKALAPRLGSIASRLGATVGDRKAADRQRNDRAPWRAWYHTKRWEDLRLEVFVRDRFVCQRTGVLCVGKHPAPNSPVANHIRPHRGDPALFWDPDNIETVTKQIHDSEIQSEEQRCGGGGGWGLSTHPP